MKYEAGGACGTTSLSMMTVDSARIKWLISMFWLALSVAYVSLLQQFYKMFMLENRFWVRWQIGYLWETVAAIVLLGGCYFAGYLLFRSLWQRWSFLRRVLVAGMVVFMWFIGVRSLISLLIALPTIPSGLANMLSRGWFKLIVHGISLPLAVLFTEKMSKGVCFVYRVLSPALVLLVVTGLSYEQWTRPDVWAIYELVEHEYRSEVDAFSGGGDVIVVIFDEWSYERTFPGDVLAEGLPNLRILSSEANVYQRAFAPGVRTVESLPRFLFQSNPEIMKQENELIRRAIFQRSRDYFQGGVFSEIPDGRLRLALGIGLDYEALLGADTDLAMRVDDPKLPFGDAVWRKLLSQLAWMRFLGVSFDVLDEWGWGYNLPEQFQQAHKAVLHVIQEARRPLFLFVHYPVPHLPYAWGPEGLIARERRGEYDWGSVEAYFRNIQGADFLLGELMDGLRKAGRYDEALLIVTSDHGWRYDPLHRGRGGEAREKRAAMAGSMRHVPLFVKQPGQTEGRLETASVFLDDLIYFRQE